MALKKAAGAVKRPSESRVLVGLRGRELLGVEFLCFPAASDGKVLVLAARKLL